MRSQTGRGRRGPLGRQLDPHDGHVNGSGTVAGPGRDVASPRVTLALASMRGLKQATTLRGARFENRCRGYLPSGCGSGSRFATPIPARLPAGQAGLMGFGVRNFRRFPGFWVLQGDEHSAAREDRSGRPRLLGAQPVTGAGRPSLRFGRVLICDIDERRLESFARRYPAATAPTSDDDLLATTTTSTRS